MEYIRAMLLGVLLLNLALELKAESCEDDTNDYTFKRIFYIRYYGTTKLVSTKESFIEAFGRCHELEEFTEDMLKYYESYGLNLGLVRRNPHQRYEDSNFIYSPDVVPEESDFRIMLETFFNYAKYRDVPVKFASWSVWAKIDHSGSSGQFPAGYLAFYGTMRFNIHGREFCIDYYTATPMPPSVNGVSTRKLILYNKHFGKGIGTGISFSNGTVLDVNYIYTFGPQS